ncbi:FAD:protein FMN transferase [Aliikangiella coralliicola]|uniref:FAD:protein FMN transferase n=1 Tax=Aliikangiella coralliicola TaxID=2592383 RepID=A0A545U6C8_9GAMM|nr:FAD:protein FMN transferase [Aliikangiella coralliicola]TQV84984.1 FAD:protein FMN transferase [Aliikangiella coralliicola]
MSDIQIEQQNNHYKIAFNAMASPCEVLLNTRDDSLVNQIAELAVNETRRVENKFSRYQQGNLCWAMNHSEGQSVSIDQECFQLLEYAEQLFELSGGLFDITSGVLRKIWRFQSGEKTPSKDQITAHCRHIGFQKLQFTQTKFIMPKHMEIDFGGIGKEYCVDKVANLITPLCQKSGASFLVNFGGDLIAANFNNTHPPWVVGLENIQQEEAGTSKETNSPNQTCLPKQNKQTVIEVSQGAIATSGSTKRFLEYEGKQYAHILNPKTGYPINGAPRTVTVFAQTCSLAGGMSTLAQLQGSSAEAFLKQSGVKYICSW